MDRALQKLGSLCRRGHEHEDTGQSLRWIKGGHCVECRRDAVARHQKARRDREMATASEDTVTCAVCGVARRRLDGHLRSEHGLSVEAYSWAYPGARTESESAQATRARSEECKAKQSASASRRWKRVGERAAQSDRMKISAPWKGKSLSPEHRAQISLHLCGVPHHLSQEQRDRIGARGKTLLAQLRQDPTYPSKLAAGVRRRIESGEQVGLMRADVRAKALESRIRNGTLAPQGSGRGICGFRVDLPHYTRSTLEANFARILKHVGIAYEYEPRNFKLPSGRFYMPDFWLSEPPGDVPAGWVELRGWRNADGSLVGGKGEKIAEFERAFEQSVFVIAEVDDLWRRIAAEFMPLIALWERPHRNLRTHPEIFVASEAA